MNEYVILTAYVSHQRQFQVDRALSSPGVVRFTRWEVPVVGSSDPKPELRYEAVIESGESVDRVVAAVVTAATSKTHPEVLIVTTPAKGQIHRYELTM